MNEQAKAQNIEIMGAGRDEALRRCAEQMAAWGLAMPPATPLVLDFGLGDFARTGLIEYWIANEIEAGYCGKYLFVFDGQTCPEHHHRDKHETFFIVKGAVEMDCGPAVRRMKAGDVLAMPTGLAHRFTGRGAALILEISKPCLVDDNYFANENIPIGGNHRGQG